MLLAKLALGLTGTLVLAGAYTFHEGVMRVDVDEDHADGSHVHLWVPAALVPVAVRVVPRHYLEHAASQTAPWLPTLRALTRELEKYPEAELVEVNDTDGHVRVRTHNGKLLIDVDQPGEQVHLACPLAMLEGVARELENDVPRV
jgi:hypothetical protein